MDKFLLAYIKQRMREMGICHYHFEPLRILLDPRTPTIVRAYNEFYYLTGIPQTSAVQIISDTNVFTGDSTGGGIRPASNASYMFYPIQEFSGLIEITSTAPLGDLNPIVFLEFIHVVPTCKEKFCVKRSCCWQAPKFISETTLKK
jgi:hypothetical protein